jgi:hypothetical protein
MEDRYDWLSGDMPESRGEPKPVRSPYENYEPLVLSREPGYRGCGCRRGTRHTCGETQIHERSLDELKEITQRDEVTHVLPAVRPSAYEEAIAVGQTIQAEDLTAREQILLIAERRFFKNVSWAMAMCLFTAILMAIFWAYEAIANSNYIMVCVAVIWTAISGVVIGHAYKIWQQYRKLPPQ